MIIGGFLPSGASPRLVTHCLFHGWWLAVCWTCSVSAATSATITTNAPLATPPEFERADLTPHVHVLEDPQGRLTIDEVAAPDTRSAFRPPGPSGTNLSFTQSVWWLTFSLSNPGDREKHLLLRQAYPLIDSIQFWHTGESGQWQGWVTGDRLPFESRALPHQDFLFPITMAPGETRTFYMRFQSQGALDISLDLFSPTNLLQQASLEQLGYGIYYGGVIVLVVYNLFIFVAVRDKAFLYYLLYILCLGLYMSCNDGLFFQFLTPTQPDLTHDALLILLGLSLLFAVHFARHILTIPSFNRTLDRAAKLTAGALTLVTLGSLVLPYHVVIVSLSLLTLVVMPLIFVMGVARFCSGYPPARYFLLAWTAFIFGTMIYMIKVFGLLPRTFFTENGFQIGSLIEIVLLSLALGSRVSELRKQSDTDGLTTLSNRRAFDQQLLREFRRSARTGQPLSLLMLDIDHFKQFNDMFGHSAGDEVLQSVGNQLRQQIRKPLIPCRFGGEEFAVILPRTNAEQAMIIAERVRSRFAQRKLAKHHITVSIGVASRQQWPFPTTADFLRAADQALYDAKDAGRNVVVLYDPKSLPPRASRKGDTRPSTLAPVN